MLKKDETTNPNSCLGKAAPDEMLFTLRGQDKTSPLVILEWMKHNFDTCPEEKLREAFECAMVMKKQGKKKAD